MKLYGLGAPRKTRSNVQEKHSGSSLGSRLMILTAQPQYTAEEAAIGVYIRFGRNRVGSCTRLGSSVGGFCLGIHGPGLVLGGVFPPPSFSLPPFPSPSYSCSCSFSCFSFSFCRRSAFSARSCWLVEPDVARRGSCGSSLGAS